MGIWYSQRVTTSYFRSMLRAEQQQNYTQLQILWLTLELQERKLVWGGKGKIRCTQKDYQYDEQREHRHHQNITETT